MQILEIRQNQNPVPELKNEKYETPENLREFQKLSAEFQKEVLRGIAIFKKFSEFNLSDFYFSMDKKKYSPVFCSQKLAAFRNFLKYEKIYFRNKKFFDKKLEN